MSLFLYGVNLEWNVVNTINSIYLKNNNWFLIIAYLNNLPHLVYFQMVVFIIYNKYVVCSYLARLL